MTKVFLFISTLLFVIFLESCFCYHSCKVTLVRAADTMLIKSDSITLTYGKLQPDSSSLLHDANRLDSSVMGEIGKAALMLKKKRWIKFSTQFRSLVLLHINQDYSDEAFGQALSEFNVSAVKIRKFVTRYKHTHHMK